MRPLRLDVIGFAAFRKQTTLDFTDTDFFALVGPTGAGKSTVLDAICFALYGKVPRWNGTGVRDALAPSTGEARVRLIFAAGGKRYVATRVVRRNSKGDVSTFSAGLERIPEGVDVSKIDEVDAAKLGQVLAGSPSEMAARVEQVIGLPYDQFTKCVVLPQGAFAEFLRAKNAERQKILENLLGLDVYKKIGQQANTRASAAKGGLDQLDRQLAELGAVGEEEIAAASDQIERTRRLESRLKERVPELREARAAVEVARKTLGDVEEHLAVLRAVSPPVDLESTTQAVAEAETAVAEAGAARDAAEDAEGRLRTTLGESDPARFQALLNAYDEHEAKTARIEKGRRKVAEMETAAGAARKAAETAADAAKHAEAALEAARTTDVAAALRPHLVAGEPCPVCDRRVDELPAPLPAKALELAGKAHELARHEHTAAATLLTKAETQLQNGISLLEELVTEHAATAKRLEGVPGRAETIAAIEEAERQRLALTEAGRALAAAREQHRKAESRLDAVRQRVAKEWLTFDTARDRLARLGPPPADRRDLRAAWDDLAGWVGERLTEALSLHGEARAEVEKARANAAAVDDELLSLLAEADRPVPSSADGSDYLTEAARALSQAEHDYKQLVKQREQAGQLRLDREEKQGEALVAEQLARHLNARNFLAWLTRAALDILLEDATAILRDLSGGQYDLEYEGDQFYVVDHHDAGQKRPAYTLSGGETFAASLALALALSRQLAGMSAGTAHLESIMLDEGFGTLDASTLDTVATTLEALAVKGDRMVGVVTHVPALADRIPIRFEVTKDAAGARVEKVVT
ncbi:SMC family ATPase [Phytomonospora sp. NPDC050363]|uniref:SMC family ATPase n=1 Tax=Phytomonospora sp. NPDC050363 TaxID=3155642 RepID=UPI003404C233